MSDENIRIDKRLFLTATPRHIDIRHRDKDGEFRVNSMDEEAIYGPRAHTLSFAAAANRSIICPYKVIISFINKEMVDDFTRKNGITIVENDEIGTHWLANLIAIQRAVAAVGAKKIITFHNRVRLAQEFAANNTHGLRYYLPDYDVRHVNGAQRSAVRSSTIQAFRSASRAVLTNARCLTEGVDIPAVDMVAFIDPRQSKVDIAQAVGRAMRKPRQPTAKTIGYVVVPLFVGMDEDSLDAALESERFSPIADVLNALQENDDELVDIIRELNENDGAGRPFNPRRLQEKVEVLGPRLELEALSKSIFVRICKVIGSTWDEWYGRLVAFKEREGHCLVPQFNTEGRNGLDHGSATSVQSAIQCRPTVDDAWKRSASFGIRKNSNGKKVSAILRASGTERGTVASLAHPSRKTGIDWVVGSASSAKIAQRCRRSADDGWRSLASFGTHLSRNGRKVLAISRHSKSAKGIVECLKDLRLNRGTGLGHGSAISGRIDIRWQPTGSDGWTS